MHYFIHLDFGKAGTEWTERSSEARVAQDILDGQIENVLTVLEVVEDEHSCRDVTEDVARKVYDKLFDEGEGCPDRLKDWIDQQLGANAADALMHPHLQVLEAV